MSDSNFANIYINVYYVDENIIRNIVTIVIILARLFYLALINRAGGLYGRILTEVVSTDRTQDNTGRLSSVNNLDVYYMVKKKTLIRLM